MNEELEDYLEKLSNLSKVLTQITSEIDLDLPSIDTDTTNDIFRHIHSMKATTHYHNFVEIAILFEKTEDILFFIRNYNCSFNESVLLWFNNLCYQIDRWVMQIENEEEPEYYALDFEEAPIVKCSNYISSKLNESYEIVIFNKEDKVSSLLTEILHVKFKYVQITNTITETIDLISTPGKKVLITDLKFPDGTILDLINELELINFNIENMFIVSKFQKEESVKLFKEKLKLDTVYNINTTKMSEIKKIIVNKYEENKSEVEIPINKNKMSLIELTESIEPLPETLSKLKNACFSDNTSMKDIINIIQTDPMFISIILKAVNSPYIGLSNRVSKVSVAASLLGKRQIGSLAIVETTNSELSNHFLDAYNISLNNLIKVSQTRIKFVNEWIKYIDLTQEEKDDIISLLYLLPLGLIITNQAIIVDNLQNRFINLLPTVKSHMNLETTLLGFNNLDVLGKLFSIWNLPTSIKAIIPSTKEKGYKTVSTFIKLQGDIVDISMKIFKYNGSFMLNREIMRYAENRELSGNDMKNIFLEITNGKQNGNILN